MRFRIKLRELEICVFGKPASGWARDVWQQRGSLVAWQSVEFRSQP